jgi:hypothetical protein
MRDASEFGVMERQPSAGRRKLPHTAALDFSHEDYGQHQTLILNAGGGYYPLLAGMDRINVPLGDFVLTGKPVGAMGDGSTRTATTAAAGAARPVRFDIELLKDGTATVPGPWWARSDIEKAGG